MKRDQYAVRYIARHDCDRAQQSILSAVEHGDLPPELRKQATAISISLMHLSDALLLAESE